MRLTAVLRPNAGTAAFGVGMRAEDEKSAAVELRFLPHRHRIEVPGGAALEDFDISDRLSIDLYVQDDMLDVCLDGRRTFVSRVPASDGDKLLFFSTGADTVFEYIRVQPIETHSDNVPAP
jgi:hypothetical protein